MFNVILLNLLKCGKVSKTHTSHSSSWKVRLNFFNLADCLFNSKLPTEIFKFTCPADPNIVPPRWVISLIRTAFLLVPSFVIILLSCTALREWKTFGFYSIHSWTATLNRLLAKPIHGIPQCNESFSFTLQFSSVNEITLSKRFRKLSNVKLNTCEFFSVPKSSYVENTAT